MAGFLLTFEEFFFTLHVRGGLRKPPLAEIIITPNSANKTSFLVIDFMDMVIRQLFVKKKYSES